jgi:hypothetical protein
VSDEEWIAAFETGNLNSKEFHHAEHVRKGFLYLRRLAILKALARFSGALQRLARASGGTKPVPRDDHMGLPIPDPRTPRASKV